MVVTSCWLEEEGTLWSMNEVTRLAESSSKLCDSPDPGSYKVGELLFYVREQMLTKNNLR